MSKVSQIITETVLKRMEEAEKNGEVFYWVKPFSEGSPNKPYSYDTGIPYRHDFCEMPPRVEYGLTELGRQMLPIIDALADFGNYYKSVLNQ